MTVPSIQETSPYADDHHYSNLVGTTLGQYLQKKLQSHPCGLGETAESLQCLQGKARLKTGAQVGIGLSVFGVQVLEHIAGNVLDFRNMIFDPAHFGDHYSMLFHRNVYACEAAATGLWHGFVYPFATVQDIWTHPTQGSVTEDMIIDGYAAHYLALLNLVGLGEFSWAAAGFVEAGSLAATRSFGGQTLVLQGAGVGAGDVMLGGVVGAESTGALTGTGALDASLAAVLNAPARSVSDGEGIGDTLEERIQNLCRRLSDEQSACLKKMLADEDFSFGQVSSENLAEIRRLFPEPSAELSPNQWTAEHWVRVVVEDAVGREYMMPETFNAVARMLQKPAWKNASLPDLPAIKATELGMNNAPANLMGSYSYRQPWAIAWKRLNPKRFESLSAKYSAAKQEVNRGIQEIMQRGTPTNPDAGTVLKGVETEIEPIFQEIIDDPGYRGLLDPAKPNPFDC